ncbi:MAG: DNA repair protein RecO [Endozoicomonas sp.]
MNELSAAWMLHSRPYKERSVIAEFLVEGHGRVAMVVRGVRQARSRHAPLLQPFTKVLTSWRGRGELKTLLTLEPCATVRLTGKALFCGLYINELVLRAVLPGHWLEGLSELYEPVLEKLADDLPVEPVLRLFEMELLELTGYLPSLFQDAASGADIEPDRFYRLAHEQGLVPVDATRIDNQSFLYPGELLLALANRDFSNTCFYPGFKRFTRQALAPLTGNKPMRSRELFSKMATSTG